MTTTKPVRRRNPVGYFEIAVSDIDRAVTFYHAVFGFDFERVEIDGNQMALFPWHETDDGLSLDQTVTGIAGALAQGESYVPGQQGCRLYFHSDDIQESLNRAVTAGGKVLYPKTSIGELGWCAEFQDSEGNCIALNQPPDEKPAAKETSEE